MALTPVKWLRCSRKRCDNRPTSRWSRVCCAQTAGNPFFIEELSGHLQDSADAAPDTDPAEIPTTIQQAVAHRVARLGSQAVALLTAGAVLGPEFDLELAAEIEGLPLDPALRALEHAVHGGLILEVPDTPGRFTFAHALVRDALAGSLTASRRARLHALAAAALEPRAQRDPERHLADLVQHALEGASLADDPLRAAELARAGCGTRQQRVRLRAERRPAGESVDGTAPYGSRPRSGGGGAVRARRGATALREP